MKPAIRQKGAVLVVSLIMLAVMTLFVISMLKTSIIELKIGGASHVTAINFSNAELAINNFINANQGRFAPGFLVPGAVNPVVNVAPAVDRGTVTVDVVELRCASVIGALGTQLNLLQGVQFDVRATARGELGGTTVMHQGVEAILPSGACA